MSEFPRVQTATEEMTCGSCGDAIPEGDKHYWHSTGMVECMACHEVNDEEEQKRNERKAQR